MPRFIHLRHNGRFLKDDERLELQDEAHALEAAESAVSTLIRHRLIARQALSTDRYQVTDEDDALLFIVC